MNSISEERLRDIAVTLFESDPQHREKATIWRVFSLLPLYGALAEGHIWRWFAINIPMDLRTAGEFTGEIDIIARLSDFPSSQDWFYKTWEVKVSLLSADGTAHSLKVGKTQRTANQLRAYREFGAPDVSLLECYICEAGFMKHSVFPPQRIRESATGKMGELNQEGFGYHLLPFEHDRDVSSDDAGLRAIALVTNPLQTNLKLLSPRICRLGDPFATLAGHLDDFFESNPERSKNHMKQIVFCWNCRALQIISMKESSECPNCHGDLILQS